LRSMPFPSRQRRMQGRVTKGKGAWEWTGGTKVPGPEGQADQRHRPRRASARSAFPVMYRIWYTAWVSRQPNSRADINWTETKGVPRKEEKIAEQQTAVARPSIAFWKRKKFARMSRRSPSNGYWRGNLNRPCKNSRRQSRPWRRNFTRAGHSSIACSTPAMYR